VTSHLRLPITDNPQIELVKDKTTKTPFSVTQKIAPAIHAAGLQKFEIALLPGGGVVDGVHGDLIVLAPPYTVNEQDVDLIVDRTVRAIESVLSPAAPASRL
jgi:adenosylmethionine-8-amino-7-oxononanoate aminotransferase